MHSQGHYLVLSFIALAAASHTVTGHSSGLAMKTTCELETLGNGDIYGIGVRIGIYLQWAAGFILCSIGSWETVSRVRIANNVLCGALALSAAISIADGLALSVDYLLSYYLTIVLFYSESYNLVLVENGEDVRVIEVEHPHADSLLSRDYEKIYKLNPDLPLIFQNVLFGSYSLFGAWFWHVGLQHVQPTSCSEKAAILILFNLRTQRWITAAASLSILFGLIFSVLFFIHVAGLKNGIRYGPVITATYYFGILSGYSPYLHLSKFLAAVLRPTAPRGRRQVLWPKFFVYSFHYCIINLVGPIVSIVSVERMISSNRLITPGITSSTGQIIALFTGSCSMFIALWELGIWVVA